MSLPHGSTQMSDTNNIKKHTFNHWVDTVLGEAIKISDQRGGEYQDTWSLENTHTPFLDHVLRIGYIIGTHPLMDKRYKRLITMSSMLDVKLSRWLGSFKDDTPVDMINYLACFTGFMRDWQKAEMLKAMIEAEKSYTNRD